MASDDPDTRSLAETREKRVRKATERGAERDAELEKLRKARETKRLKEQIAEESQSCLPDGSRSLQLIFGAAEPTLTGDPEIDKANQLTHKAHTLIKALAHRTSIDYTKDYEHGKITLTELEGLLKVGPAVLEPMGKGKAKATDATPLRPENHPGVIFGQSPQTIRSKHNATIRYGSAPAEPSPSKPITNSKRPSDHDSVNEASKARRLNPSAKPDVVTSPSRPSGATYPPLKRTDNSTIAFGKRLPHPQSIEDNPRITSASAPTRRVRPTHALASPGYVDDNVPSPKARQYALQPQARPVGTIRVPTSSSAPAPRSAQPQVVDLNSHVKAKALPPPKPTSSNQGVRRIGPSAPPPPPASRVQGNSSTTPASPGTTSVRPLSHVPKATDRKRAMQAATPAGQPSKPSTVPSLAKSKPTQHLQPREHISAPRGIVPASAGSHSRAKLAASNKTNVSNAIQPGSSRASAAQERPAANQVPAAPRTNEAPRRRVLNSNNNHSGVQNRTRGSEPNAVDTEPNAPGQDNDADNGRVLQRPNTVVYQVKPLNPNKPALVMFDAEVQDLLKLAEVRARGEIIANGTFDYSLEDPGDVVRSHDDIIAGAWRWACKKRRMKKPYLAVYGKYIDGLVTSYRGQTKGDVKKILDSQLEFKEDTPEKNIETHNKMLPDAFHHGDPDKRLHPFENPFLAKACREAAFVGLKPWAIKFPKLFNPLPPRFIAFILAIANHVIHGYRDSVYNADDRLCVPTQIQAFRKYLNRLMDMRQERPLAYRSHFTEMYDECRTQAEKQKAPPPPSPSPPRQWSPDITDAYVSKYAAPLSDDSDAEPEPQPEPESAPEPESDPNPEPEFELEPDPEGEPESEPEPKDAYMDDGAPADDDDDDFGPGYLDGVASGSSSRNVGEAHAGPSTLVPQFDDEEPSDQEMVEYEDEGEKELDDDEVTDN